jgi:hypothetical protein
MGWEGMVGGDNGERVGKVEWGKKGVLLGCLVWEGSSAGSCMSEAGGGSLEEVWSEEA